MTEILTGLLALGMGGLLGTIFFGGLWWTVRKLVTAKRPALLLVASFLLRTAITLAGFYVVADRQWQRLVLCLLGFILARLLVTWLTRTADNKPMETRHAPEPR